MEDALPDESIFPRERVTIWGVLNATPDSFSDGGRLLDAAGRQVDVRAAVEAGREMLAAGVHVLDVGGESTRPGADEVAAATEVARTAPVVRALVSELGATVSIDTRKSRVAEEALAAGARVVNDVSGLRHDPELARVVAASDATLLVGHMRGTPATMQRSPFYGNALTEVAAELEASLERARRAGVPEARLAVDPGIGFGKRFEDNLQLLAHAG